MPEIPERKTLKEILPKLKAKAIESEALFNQTANKLKAEYSASLEFMKQELQKLEGSAKGFGLALTSVEQNKQTQINLLIANATSVIRDLKIYIELLEKYSSELGKAYWRDIDKTTKEIVRKMKQQREQSKHQEELRKKQNPLTA